MTVFTNKRVDKEWLSMHQCIDEYCPVHSENKTKSVTSTSGTFNKGISNKNVEDTDEQNRFESDFNKKAQKSKELNIKETDLGEDNNIEIANVFQNQATGAFKQIAECCNDEKGTYRPTESLKTLMLQYKDDTGETPDFSKNEGSNKRVLETFKPRFMCTWLNNNVDMNNFPFYKTAVYSSNQRVVRKEFAVFPSFVTDHIWASHKYIGESEDTDIVCGISVACGAASKASRSHENLSESIDKVLKDMPDVNISDLVLKYGFLFNPDFMSKTTKMGHAGEEKYPYGVKPRNLRTPQTYPSLKLKENIKVSDDRNYVCPKEQSTLNNKTTVNFDSIKNEDCDKSPYYSPSQMGFQSYCARPNLSSDMQTFDLQGSTGHLSSPKSGTSDRCSRMAGEKNVHNLSAYCDYGNTLTISGSPNAHDKSKYKYGSQPNGDFIPHANLDNKIQSPLDSISVQHSESPNSPYSPSSVLKGISQKVFPQTPVVSPLYNSYKVGNTSQASTYWNMSPLVSSPTFSHYISPAQLKQATYTGGQTFHFFTKRNNDPRLQSHGSRNTDDKRTNVQYYHTHHLHDSPVPPSCKEYFNKKDGHQTNTFEQKARRGSVERSLRKHRDQAYVSGEDEDPLNGLLHHVNNDKQLRPEKYCGSPDSEIFYRLHERQNGEEQYPDVVMDTFYTDDRPFQKHIGSYTSSLHVSARYRSRSPRHTHDGHHGETRDRLRLSPRARSTRERSISRERYTSKSRFPTSQICRRSKSSSMDRRCDRLPESSRKRRELGKHARHKHDRERSVPRTDKKLILSSNKSRFDTNSSHGEHENRSILRESKRHEKCLRRENECYRKRSSETTMPSACSAKSSRSSVCISSYKTHKQSSRHRKRRDRNDASYRQQRGNRR